MKFTSLMLLLLVLAVVAKADDCSCPIADIRIRVEHDTDIDDPTVTFGGAIISPEFLSQKMHRKFENCVLSF